MSSSDSDSSEDVRPSAAPQSPLLAHVSRPAPSHHSPAPSLASRPGRTAPRAASHDDYDSARSSRDSDGYGEDDFELPAFGIDDARRDASLRPSTAAGAPGRSARPPRLPGFSDQDPARLAESIYEALDALEDVTRDARPVRGSGRAGAMRAGLGGSGRGESGTDRKRRDKDVPSFARPAWNFAAVKAHIPAKPPRPDSNATRPAQSRQVDRPPSQETPRMPPHDTAPAAPSGRAPEVAAQPLTAMQRFRKLKKAVQLRDHVQTNEFVKAAHYLAGVLALQSDPLSPEAGPGEAEGALDAPTTTLEDLATRQEGQRRRFLALLTGTDAPATRDQQHRALELVMKNLESLPHLDSAEIALLVENNDMAYTDKVVAIAGKARESHEARTHQRNLAFLSTLLCMSPETIVECVPVLGKSVSGVTVKGKVPPDMFAPFARALSRRTRMTPYQVDQVMTEWCKMHESVEARVAVVTAMVQQHVLFKKPKRALQASTRAEAHPDNWTTVPPQLEARLSKVLRGVHPKMLSSKRPIFKNVNVRGVVRKRCLVLQHIRGTFGSLKRSDMTALARLSEREIRKRAQERIRREYQELRRRVAQRVQKKMQEDREKEKELRKKMEMKMEEEQRRKEMGLGKAVDTAGTVAVPVWHTGVPNPKMDKDRMKEFYLKKKAPQPSKHVKRAMWDQRMQRTATLRCQLAWQQLELCVHTGLLGRDARERATLRLMSKRHHLSSVISRLKAEEAGSHATITADLRIQNGPLIATLERLRDGSYKDDVARFGKEEAEVRKQAREWDLAESGRLEELAWALSGTLMKHLTVAALAIAEGRRTGRRVEWVSLLQEMDAELEEAALESLAQNEGGSVAEAPKPKQGPKAESGLARLEALLAEGDSGDDDDMRSAHSRESAAEDALAALAGGRGSGPAVDSLLSPGAMRGQALESVLMGGAGQGQRLRPFQFSRGATPGMAQVVARLARCPDRDLYAMLGSWREGAGLGVEKDNARRSERDLAFRSGFFRLLGALHAGEDAAQPHRGAHAGTAQGHSHRAAPDVLAAPSLSRCKHCRVLLSFRAPRKGREGGDGDSVGRAGVSIASDGTSELGLKRGWDGAGREGRGAMAVQARGSDGRGAEGAGGRRPLRIDLESEASELGARAVVGRSADSAPMRV